jgi:ribosomal protein L11 methyltransferase
MRWLALSVEADLEAVEAVSEIFGRLGHGCAIEPHALVASETDEQALTADPAAGYRVTTHVPDDTNASAAVTATEQALWHLQAFGLRPLGELTVTAVDDADWTTGWREGYVAQHIGAITIVPSWLEESASGPVIRLDPGMAFGTGLHPTTRGCLLALQRLAPMPGRVLDVGTGSGILAIAAVRLGAKQVVAWDIDPAAVEASRANAEINGVGAQIDVRQGTPPADPPAEPFPLVLANLVAAVLIDLAPRLAAHLVPGGRLVASGIIDTRAEEVVVALETEGLKTIERDMDGEWLTLVAERAA